MRVSFFRCGKGIKGMEVLFAVYVHRRQKKRAGPDVQGCCLDASEMARGLVCRGYINTLFVGIGGWDDGEREGVHAKTTALGCFWLGWACRHQPAIRALTAYLLPRYERGLIYTSSLGACGRPLATFPNLNQSGSGRKFRVCL
jgi:hypothetical protein